MTKNLASNAKFLVVRMNELGMSWEQQKIYELFGYY
jgi:hypothetical protein